MLPDNKLAMMLLTFVGSAAAVVVERSITMEGNTTREKQRWPPGLARLP